MKDRKCLKCGGKVSKNSKSGNCTKCRDRSGINNPFYGKTHSKETVDIIKEKTSAASKKLWQNDVYRSKVIKSVSKPRRDGFKQEQSERITQWYKDNPEQKKIRSQHMINTWTEGKIKPHVNSINESKSERKMLDDLRKLCPNDRIVKKTIRLNEKWYYPDVIVNDHIIIEFFGNYYHGNPSMFKSTDIVHHGFTAKSLWKSDKNRIETFKQFGYDVIIVWEKDWKDNKETVYQTILERIHEEKNIKRKI